jgi:hypothetical protein
MSKAIDMNFDAYADDVDGATPKQAENSYMSQELIEISKRKSATAPNPVKLTFHDLKYEV